ncbi:SMI1/KNR4 family protein [Rapidithrix thailandica]|uniref:SMI1/KNR4 family protein n=1 Tax=Rapidithrix thailandica TaxID=413964 RepID=A0AAW9SAZ9_9BACT
MEINAQLKRIKIKLSELKQLDKKFEIFGAFDHKYQFNLPKTEAELTEFESKYGIVLPSGYREFLKEIGNGGAGPYYGLEPLENSIFADLDHMDEKDVLNPSKPFLLEDAWNLDFEEATEEEILQAEEKYFDNQWVNGLLRISNYGCGVSLNIVVNGADYGNIWVDDRVNGGGIYPDSFFDQEDKTNFLEWYELWLDQSIYELKN